MSWIQRRRAENYYRRAKREGYRSRAVYKLKQIDEKFHIINDRMAILDLGASPGGWSQYLSEVNPNGINVAVDKQGMARIDRVSFILGDITDEKTREKIYEKSPNGYDLVVSDLLMHTTGDRSVDQARAYFLAKEVLEICRNALVNGGSVLIKTFQGDLTDQLTGEFKKYFSSVRITKPPSSTPHSPEIYILAENFSRRKLLPETSRPQE
ncbi:MAG: RlmE family RNA methyltransferase [Thermoplasmatales archaeon]